MNIYFLTLKNTSDITRCEHYVPLLPAERIERIHSLRNAKSKIISIYAGLLINNIISRETSLTNDRIAFTYNEHGKPVLTTAPDNSTDINNYKYHFSISHSGSCIAFVSSSSPIGIDIEPVSSARLNIAKKFFCKSEYDYLVNLPSDMIPVEFIRIWTKKEAYLKMTGEGLSGKLDSFDVLNPPSGIYIYTMQKDDYIISVCSKNPETGNPDIISITEDFFE